MSLKHLTRLGVKGAEQYISDGGIQVDILPRYRAWLQRAGLAPTTVERYEFAAARFLDYLIETEVFGQPASVGRMADAIELYPLFLRDGAKVASPEFPALGNYAEVVGVPAGISRNAMLPTLAAVNRLLAFAKDDALRTRAALEAKGRAGDFLDLGDTFRAIDGVEAWSYREKSHFRQSAMIGGVVRLKSRLERPRGLRKALRGGRQLDLASRDFPIRFLADLLGKARSHRDRAMWALLAGGGLRLHEALNIRVYDIRPETRQVFVLDPESRRFAREIGERDRERFKGRTVSRVTLFEPVASVFWEALAEYIKEEFVPVDNDDHLFQQLGQGRGLPLSAASDSAVQSAFKKAVLAASVPGPEEAPDHVWTPHSLRHLYGVYMLNYVPTPNGFGLSLSEVQQLMGHASIESTKVYARHEAHLLQAKVATANAAVFDGLSATEALAALPGILAAKLRDAAERLERR